MQSTTKEMEGRITCLARRLRRIERESDPDSTQAERDDLLVQLEAALVEEGIACLYCKGSDTMHTSSCAREAPNAQKHLRAGMLDAIADRPKPENHSAAYGSGYLLAFNLDYTGNR